MFLKVVIIEIGLFSCFIFLIFNFLKDFKLRKRKILIFISPLSTYIVGFSLRLTENKELIDLGFFFTEFSTIFVTILFALCLYLGQVKYWKIN